MSNRRGRLSQGQLFSLAFGSIIGVAWIPLAGFWLETAGSIGSLVAFAAACVTVLFVVAAYAEVSSMFPINGGEVAYSLIALGSPYAFSVGWFLVLLYLGFTSFELISVGWIASVLFPAIEGPVLYSFLGSDIHLGQLLIGLVTCGVIWMLNVWGKTSAAWVQTVLAYGLLAFAGLILALALAYGSASHLKPWVASPVSGSPLAGIYTVFSLALLFYGGFNFASQSFGERAVSVTPRRIAAAMFLSVLAALAFYVAIILSASLLLPRDELLALELPAAEMFESALGSRGLRDFVLVFGLIGLITSWNGAVFAGSRLLVFLSDIHLLPAAFGNHHPRYGTPVFAVAAISVVTPLIALVGQGGIFALANALSFAIAFAWLMTVVSVLRMRRSRAGHVRPYQVRPAVPVFAIAISGTAFAIVQTGRSFLDPETLLPTVEGAIALGWAMLGVVFWLVNTRRRLLVSDHDRVQTILASD